MAPLLSVRRIPRQDLVLDRKVELRVQEARAGQIEMRDTDFRERGLGNFLEVALLAAPVGRSVEFGRLQEEALGNRQDLLQILLDRLALDPPPVLCGRARLRI